MTQFNDMLAPPPVMLPADEAAAEPEITAAVVLRHPASPLAWALLAESRLDAITTTDADALAAAYAFARTGYHRSLDRLRSHGWKGWGPVPYSHEPNRGVLRAIAALARASQLIGDQSEYDRCRQMLSDADPESVATLL
ncbi:DUF3151 domain-containing protein [Corynebacterium pseudotuberculosis]|uniref:DUF3151 domain-containing protein n=1 Tax=Corynebacterium pseudotuberculosis TaxID=1719 RepID=UPI00026608BB|nr:DUF3151 domain-containing protein [Corynebacterium pseudotuberculosis]AFM06844.1 DUF3151 family protein [Corynebacterium pseudotuberculosis Cp162]APG81217.1 Hypothetical protein CPI37_0529 [Corynebacterium pseudotuberculosis]WFP67680.1 DUF3151 domain-containing protein [Corynebacterium pseudotuberculosis]